VVGAVGVLGTAGLLAVSVFPGFGGGAAAARFASTSDFVLGALVGVAGAGAGEATAVSVLAGFAGAAGFSAAGSILLSGSGFGPESDMFMDATFSRRTSAYP